MSNTNAASTTRGEQFRRARAMRIKRTRRHVAAASLSTFALAWAAIAAVGSPGATRTPKAATSISAPAKPSESESASSVSPGTAWFLIALALVAIPAVVLLAGRMFGGMPLARGTVRRT
ncbi:MAG TPA: hypothetical protein VGY76_13165 [Solirubrobacteraceae bacterium]|nr:hypothetical protein [Solirubrobacteraceae bacterium]